MPAKWPLRTTRTRPSLRLRRSTDPPHGSRTAYKWGCGCAACRQGNRDAQRQQRSGQYTPEETEIAVAPFPVPNPFVRRRINADALHKIHKV